MVGKNANTIDRYEETHCRDVDPQAPAPEAESSYGNRVSLETPVDHRTDGKHVAC